MYSYENPFNQFMTRLCHLFCLSLLWLLGSLPIFTIGAACAAVNTVTMKMVRKEDPPIFQTFLHAYCSNFKQANVIWMLLLAAAVVLICDIYCMSLLPGWLKPIGTILFLILLAVLGLVLTVVFHLLACFGNTVKGTLINALRASLGYLSFSFSLLLLLVLSVFSISRIAFMLPIMLFFGSGTYSYISSLLWNQKFITFSDSDTSVQ